MKRWLVPGVPFAVSLSLSLATVGTHPYWQDSALYLLGVKELGVLYPPGFGLYLVTCKAWTLLLFFLDFTLAVHLFSSVCAALAAGTMAVAVRDLLRSRGRIFRVLDQDPGELGDACAILAGVLLACGYTFWVTSIYAKGYALYYLVLTLLLWRMIRADDGGRPRDFTFVAVLIGLAWQCHPSATLTGAALIAFVAVHANTLGLKGVAGRVGVAAACALGPSIVLLPAFMARDPWLQMGHPETLAQFLRYVSGRQFVQMSGVFGLDAVRAASFGKYLWEEMLGVGLLLVAAGMVSLATSNRKLLIGILLWLVPYASITILFKIEGQHDCWFVAAWLPLSLAAGVGACRIAMRLGPRGTAAVAGAGLVAVAWAGAANFSDVSQRNYTLAELFGRTILEPVDRDAILVLTGDDPNALTGYLQRVKGVRPDVTLVTASFLLSRATMGSPWYDDLIRRRHPFLQPPDYEAMCRRFPEADLKDAAIAAFLNAQAETGRPLFTDRILSAAMLRPDMILAPAGVLWKLVPRDAVTEVDSKYWKFPIEPEQLRGRLRRERGQNVTYHAGRIEVKPQSYERRLTGLLLQARFNLAMVRMEQNQVPAAVGLLESIVAVDGEYLNHASVAYVLGIWAYMQGQFDRAEPLFRRASESGPRPDWRTKALFYRAMIVRKRGDEPEAQRLLRAALATPGLDDAGRAAIEKELKSP